MSTEDSTPPTSLDPLDYLDIARQILEARRHGEEPEWQVWEFGEWRTVSPGKKCPLIYIGGVTSKPQPIRLTPWTLGNSINGYTLAEGQQWHRLDWRADMLPSGTRPLLMGEPQEEGDEWLYLGVWRTIKPECAGNVTNDECAHRRTTRPLPPIKWAKEREALAAGKLIEYRYRADMMSPWNDWQHEPEPKWITNGTREYRIKPGLKTAPLGPENVPPGSVIRDKRWAVQWKLVVAVAINDLATHQGSVPWDHLQEHYDIHRPGDNDSNGKPVWRPCSKEVPA